MDKDIKKQLLSFRFGDRQHFENMELFPIFTDLNGQPEYFTMKEALEKRFLVISEVSQEGSVPELKVINKAEKAIFLLDGEELVGAKQNRVLNTSILLDQKAEIIVPVSCTEQGRWSYTSKEFSDSDTVMSPKLRMVKSKTVSDTLHDSQEYRSDQGTVWTAIDEMSASANVSSQTGAMRDVYVSRAEDLDKYLKAFSFVSDQKGMLVLINGEISGFDYISYEPAFKVLYGKLLKSYAMEAVLEKKDNAQKPDDKKIKEFIKEASASKEKKYKSVGKGWDHRYEGNKVVGSVLAYRKKVIHMAFFRVTESEKTGSMAGTTRRRRFRTR
jgi:hypothetical protein